MHTAGVVEIVYYQPAALSKSPERKLWRCLRWNGDMLIRGGHVLEKTLGCTDPRSRLEESRRMCSYPLAGWEYMCHKTV